MNLVRVACVVSALAVMGGCVAVPVGAGYYGGSSGYYEAAAPAPAYYAPPAYYGAPAYYGPSIGIGIYGGRRGYGGRRYR